MATQQQQSDPFEADIARLMRRVWLLHLVRQLWRRFLLLFFWIAGVGWLLQAVSWVDVWRNAPSPFTVAQFLAFLLAAIQHTEKSVLIAAAVVGASTGSLLWKVGRVGEKTLLSFCGRHLAAGQGAG